MITAIIQARMNSTRLPGKVMARFSGNTLLGHIIDRLSYSKYVSRIVVATTIDSTDDTLVDWLRSNQIEFFRGSESDVLNRYYEAAKQTNAIHIARITADDPFKDPQVIDEVAKMYFEEKLDFAYNNKPPTFPEGLDTEIFSFEALAVAEKDARDPFEREHMTQHFYRNPEKFIQKNLRNPMDLSYLRWTIDNEEDLTMAKLVYKNLQKPDQIFLMADILSLIERHPEIPLINQHVKRSEMFKK